MRALIGMYGAVVLVAYCVVAVQPDYFGNVGFLVVGTLVGIYPAFLIEEYRRARSVKDLTNALFQELANRVARCCYDLEKPWGGYLQSPEGKTVFQLRKFSPEPPIVFPAVAGQIATLRSGAAQALIEFYISLAAWRRDIDSTADDAVQNNRSIRAEQASTLAWRLRLTLQPGLDALERVSAGVDGAEQIELDAIGRLDKQNPDPHPHAGKALRERIKLALVETERNKTLASARAG